MRSSPWGGASGESGRRRIQVFREGDYHYAIEVPGTRDELPVAFDRTPDGRFVVALEASPGTPGGLHLIDRAGRPLGRLDVEEPVAHPADLVVVPGAKHGSGMSPQFQAYKVERQAWRFAIQEYLIKE